MATHLSNGTMGEMWMAEWCHRCVHDHDMSHEGGEGSQGCGVLLRILAGDHPVPELVDTAPGGEPWGPRHLECRMWERCPCLDDPGWKATPAPIDDPDQGLLFAVVGETPGTPMLALVLDEKVEV